MTMFYNDHDIADAVARYGDLPNLGQAARTLDRLADWANHNSDGWAYWAKPRNAARRLVELIAGVDRFDPEDVTAEALALALRPVKAFLTRQGVDHAEILADPCWRCGGGGMLWGEEHGPHGTRCCPVCSPCPTCRALPA